MGVVVRTKHNDDEQYVWTSSAGGTFDIVKDAQTDLKRGTEITLHMREDAHDYIDEKRIKDLVKSTPSSSASPSRSSPPRRKRRRSMPRTTRKRIPRRRTARTNRKRTETTRMLPKSMR